MHFVFNKTHKFNNSPYFSFKSFNLLFNPLKKQTIEGQIEFVTNQNSLIFIDFGFGTKIESFSSEILLRIPNFLSLAKKCNYIKNFSCFNFKIIVLQNFFLNETLIKKHCKFNFKLLLLIFIKQKSPKKFCFKGRVLNKTKNGFSIGLGGLIGFLPKTASFSKLSAKLGLISIFYIFSIDKLKQKIVLSQKQIGVVLKKRLKKLCCCCQNIKSL